MKNILKTEDNITLNTNLKTEEYETNKTETSKRPQSNNRVNKK